jgi:tetratricopeptide (TPR) repeat protein
MRRRLAWLVLVVAAVASCAPKTAPSLPAALKYPDFVYPAVPGSLASARGADAIDRGWRQLQNDRLREAEREFTAAGRGNPAMYPAQAGRGYVALARGDSQRALTLFDGALAAAGGYVPALVGRGQALLALNRDADALAAFETAVAADPSLTDLRRRIDVLRFRNVQD